MARSRGSVKEQEAPAAPEEEAAVTSPASSSSETEKVELTDEQIEEALQPFHAAVSTAVESRDTSTGTISDEQQGEVNKAFAALEGTKVRNAAKRALNEAMKAAMSPDANDIVLARSYMELSSHVTAASPKAARTPRAPKPPADPTEAFVERVAVLNLGYSLVAGSVPEGVASDWEERVQTLVNSDYSQVSAWQTWLLGDEDSRGEEPEASDTAKAAVKLSLGRSARPGKAAPKASSGGGSTFNGPRRSVAKHITEAFADKSAGDFMLVSEIGNYTSGEYGDDHPSQGAISARLFPKSGKCTLEGVEPSTDDSGNKGARKV